MKSKTVLITGANRGIGFETARQLLQKGFHLIITGRNDLKLTDAYNKLKHESDSLEMVIMDVNSDESVKSAASMLKDRKIRLDVLINNAAIMLRHDRSLIKQDAEVLTSTINTNCYGPLRVIRSFLLLMNSPGEIINISSGGGSMTDPVGGWSPAYCVSKTMLNALTRQLAYELSDLNISVNSVCPGWVQTELGGASAPRTLAQGAETPVWLASDAPHELTGKFFRDKTEIKW